MGTDRFNAMRELTGPAPTAKAVTLSDSNELDPYSRGLYVGVGGDVKVTTVDGDAVTFKNAVAGSVLPVRAKLVWATGTTATDIVSLS